MAASHSVHSFCACVCHLSDVVLDGYCCSPQRFVHKSLFSLLGALHAAFPRCATGWDRVSSGRTTVIRSQYITATRPTLPSESEHWLDTFVPTSTHIFALLGALSSGRGRDQDKHSVVSTDLLRSSIKPLLRSGFASFFYFLV